MLYFELVTVAEKVNIECICFRESFTAWKMANYVVELMNKELHSFNLTECSTLAIDKKPDVVEFSPIDETNLYKIEFYAKPGKGRFEVIEMISVQWTISLQALVRAHDPSNVTSYTLASPYFNRLNAYGHVSDHPLNTFQIFN